jgi:hypothetical protein
MSDPMQILEATNNVAPAEVNQPSVASAEEVRAELERVLQSQDFPATLRNRRFLSFITERALDGQANGNGVVSAYDVATCVFGRSEQFDTILDPIVRIEAGKLRRDLETYYLKSGRCNPWRIEVPRGGYSPVFIRQQSEPETMPTVPPPTGELATDVAAEMQRLMESPDFRATARNRNFLTYVVENELGGRAEETTAMLVAKRIFGRPANFDPNKDPIVRIEAGKLRRDLETYYLKSGAHNPLRISLPKGAYRPVFEYQK